MRVDVRPADVVEISDVLRLLAQEHRAAPPLTAPPPYDAATATETVLRGCRAGLVFVAYCDGIAAGTIGGAPMQHWWSRTWCIQHLWWYVLPAYRASRAAVMLLDRFMAEAAAKPASVYMSINLVDERQDRAMRRLLRRRGLAAVGSTFWNGAAP